MRKEYLTALASLVTGVAAAVAQAPATLGRPVAASLGRPVAVTQVSYVEASLVARPVAAARTGAPTPNVPEAVFRGQDPIDPCSPTCAPVAAGNCCCNCGTRFWVSAEYLMWWIKDSPVPTPLVSTGTLGSGGQVLLGQENIDNEMRNGGRFSAGYWFDSSQQFGIEGNYFFLGTRSVTQQIGSSGAPGSPPLAIPFLNTFGAPFEDSLPFAGPSGFFGVFPAAGNSYLNIESFLQGAEANAIWNFYNCNCWRWGAIGGFRFLELDENLALSNKSIAIGTPFAGTQVQFLDQFDMRNRFYGGQIGLRGEYKWSSWFVNGTGKIAFGGLQRTQEIMGQTVTPGGTLPEGAFTAATNIGHHTDSQFAVLPEININVGYDFNQWLRVYVGYDFLFINNVLRPGDQIDHAFGGTHPAVLNNDSTFWAQGLNFGVEVRW